MNKHPNENLNTSDDEIDLGILLLKMVKTIKRNFKIFLLFLILGLLSGWAYFSFTHPNYESSLVISSTILSKENATNLIESLQELIDDGNFTLLASKLNVDEVEAPKISEIRIEVLDNSRDQETAGPIFVEITALVKDNSILPQLEKGIVSFLEYNQYVNQRVNINKQKYKALIDKTQQEIDQIDSLKYKIGEGLIVKSETPNVLMMEPVNIYTASVTLFEKKQEYIKKLELASDIHLIKGLIAFQKPVSPKLVLSLAGGLAIGLVLAIIVVFSSETGIYLKKLNKQHYS